MAASNIIGGRESNGNVETIKIKSKAAETAIIVYRDNVIYKKT